MQNVWYKPDIYRHCEENSFQPFPNSAMEGDTLWQITEDYLMADL